MKAKYLLLGMAVTMMHSCDFLDFDETNGLKTKEEFYQYFDETTQILTNIYAYVPQDYGSIGGAMRECGSDDAEYSNVGAGVQSFNNGNWSSLNTLDNEWRLYRAIRAANGFLIDIQNVNFSRFSHDGNYVNWMAQLKNYPYEARLLRAFYFFELARRYGDIAMPQTVLKVDEANDVKKTTFEDVIKFICTECDECAKVLPETFYDVPGNQVGRVTKGFAMALKSKALLYAASKLHNLSMDKAKWELSADAAWQLINTKNKNGNALYQLDPVSKANNFKSKEVVFFRLGEDDTYFEQKNFPISFTDGKSTGQQITMPSGNLADAFETIKGYKVTLTENGYASDDPDFDPQNPYINRDPRMGMSIISDGYTFKERKIELYKGGTDYDALNDNNIKQTGFFLRKYIQESTSFDPNALVTNKHQWIVYRYAETLLTYAESMIEAFGEPNYTDNKFTKSALWAINEVRANAQMPMINNCSKDEFIKKLRNERRVEFAFEDHRFWDIRRWKIGDETQKELYGVEIEKEGTVKTYKKKVYEKRIWDDRMYLYPIPKTELYRNQNLFPQNVGWK